MAPSPPSSVFGRMTTFVQQSKRENAPRAENFYSLRRKELCAFRTAPAPRIPSRFVQHGPYIEGLLCSEAEPLGFMIYEL